MKSIQDYRNIYRGIAENLGIQGDSVELLVQLLSQHSYINEVENASYLRESSMESSVLMNSKIQHCVDDMYSVFRGECPRILLKFIPQKSFTFRLLDQIATSSNFNLYYLGHIVKENGEKVVKMEDYTVYPEFDLTKPDTDLINYEIITLLSPTKLKKVWNTTYLNLYYVDYLEEDLSNDVFLFHGNERLEITRDFGAHIVEGSVFDLTLPSYSSRLYIADTKLSGVNAEQAEENLSLTAYYFPYSTVDSYNLNELKKINIPGMKFVSWGDDIDKDRVLNTGIQVIYEKSRDTITSLHYKASKDKFISTMIRSNDDICRLFKEVFIGKVASEGVTYSTENSTIEIKYITANENVESLNLAEIEEFKEKAKAYYIPDKINITKVEPITVPLILELVPYENADTSTLNDSLVAIVEQYNRKFGINLEEAKLEIKGLIDKISCIRYVKYIEFNLDNIQDSTKDQAYLINPSYSIVS